jgi:hypothetical protein
LNFGKPLQNAPNVEASFWPTKFPTVIRVSKNGGKSTDDDRSERLSTGNTTENAAKFWNLILQDCGLKIKTSLTPWD